ncbi:MAG: UvrD-helicase domain-containing protein, partial [Alphaproteobacteria bacterium]|nr:UvrD-helicase domain-containing protein [Alphaproteobacteria bacterium]
YLATLNPAQRQAVEALDGPVLVLAGAGTGKTRVLTTRLAHLIWTRRIRPGQVLAVTFTNKAAREMRERVEDLLGAPVAGLWLGTFHALAARILRRHAEQVGLGADFTILDTDDQIRLVKQLLEAEQVDAKRWPARLVLSVIERWKDKGLTPDRLKPEDAGDVAGGRMVELYRAYQDRLKTLNACDFGDLLLHNLTLFAKREQDAAGNWRHPILEDWQHRFRYILVDEYQDTNQAQYLWLRYLAQGHRNLCCVGDEDQSIYGWRGAEIGNILRFESDFPGARVIRLEQNYRSTATILGAASGLIANNQGRLGKTLFTEGDAGEHIVVRSVWDSEDEARWVAEEIEALQRAGTPLNQIAVLVRAGFQMRGFEERFLAIGLPYRVVGGPRFYERREIRDAMAYLRVIAQPADDLAFERIVNVPKRGIGATTLKTIHQVARARAVPLLKATALLVDSDELKPRARTPLKALLGDFFRWREAVAREPHWELAQQVLDESGYTAMWQQEKTADAQGRLENLQELIAAMKEFDSLAGFLEHVGLVMDTVEDRAADMVTIMTLHGAKGLEFDHVFLPGWEEGVFPNQRALDETGIAGLEEERRLAYVGLTRARHKAWVSTAANRQIHGQWTSCVPSRFVDELPEDLVAHDADSGLGGFQETGGGFFFKEPPQTGFMRRTRAVTLEGRAEEVQPRARPSTPFAKGERVFHTKFGYGTVEAVDNDKLSVAFDHTGTKKVMDSFLQRPEDV